MLAIERDIDQIKPGDVLVTKHTPSGKVLKTEPVKKVQWSRRGEWCKVNDSLIYSAGGTYLTA